MASSASAAASGYSIWRTYEDEAVLWVRTAEGDVPLGRRPLR